MASDAIARIIIDLPSRDVDRLFDYLVPPELAGSLAVGSIVAVPFGRTERTGFVVELAASSELDGGKLRPVRRVLRDTPALLPEMVELSRWMADYYVSTFAACLRLALPPGGAGPLIRRWLVAAEPGLREEDAGAGSTREEAALAAVATRAPKQARLMRALGERGVILQQEAVAEFGQSAVRGLIDKGLAIQVDRPKERSAHSGIRPESGTVELTREQRRALEVVDKTDRRVILLEGVTGSGKTEVYLRAIERTLDQGRTAIVLVPEISLTPQTVGRFRARFGDDVAVLHSALRTGERFDQWHVLLTGWYRVEVGARSAVFAPLAGLGLIVVDEEHQTSYKQGRDPFYHAREVAIKRADLTGAKVILGSATPSIESRRHAETGEFAGVRLPERVGPHGLPAMTVVDMREEIERRRGGIKPAGEEYSVFSDQLRSALMTCRERGEKAIVFLNRRGFASFVMCRSCGKAVQCASCSVSLTYHQRGNLMLCHHCGHHAPPPLACPECGSREIHQFGVGTQRVEAELVRLLDGAPVIRMDADTTTRKGAHEALLTRFKKTPGAVLLGTQMIAQGLDFPEVTLVGIVNADTALNLPDFRAAERTYQLLMQVSGRAGRGGIPGRVIVQTYAPESPAVQAAQAADLEAFYQAELAERQELGYPPHRALINLILSGPVEAEVAGAAGRLAGMLADAEGVAQAVGPAPAPLARIKNRFRWHIMLKCADAAAAKSWLSARRRDMLALCGAEGRSGLRLLIDVDPVWVL